jgi:hypothetical protein
MSGSFADRLPFRRVPLAFALCLLAFLFAIEAKTAMYGPENGLGSDVRAAKALPAVTPKLLKQRVLSPDPLHLAFTSLSTAAAVTSQEAHLPQRTRVNRNHLPLFMAAFLSPLRYFRPPPAL